MLAPNAPSASGSTSSHVLFDSNVFGTFFASLRALSSGFLSSWRLLLCLRSLLSLSFMLFCLRCCSPRLILFWILNAPDPTILTECSFSKNVLRKVGSNCRKVDVRGVLATLNFPCNEFLPPGR
jgi:hypothetical protein